MAGRAPELRSGSHQRDAPGKSCHTSKPSCLSRRGTQNTWQIAGTDKTKPRQRGSRLSPQLDLRLSPPDVLVPSLQASVLAAAWPGMFAASLQHYRSPLTARLLGPPPPQAFCLFVLVSQGSLSRTPAHSGNRPAPAGVQSLEVQVPELPCQGLKWGRTTLRLNDCSCKPVCSGSLRALA